jgi:hypothetical protein
MAECLVTCRSATSAVARGAATWCRGREGATAGVATRRGGAPGRGGAAQWCGAGRGHDGWRRRGGAPGRGGEVAHRRGAARQARGRRRGKCCPRHGSGRIKGDREMRIRRRDGVGSWGGCRVWIDLGLLCAGIELMGQMLTVGVGCILMALCLYAGTGSTRG